MRNELMTPKNKKRLGLERKQKPKVEMIKRGEVYRVKIIDARGKEQKGNKKGDRLAVVVSDNLHNSKNNTIIIVPLTSKIKKKNYLFHVPTFFQGKPGKAKCEQVRTLTIERFGRKPKLLGQLTEQEMREINKTLLSVLGLEEYFEEKLKEILTKYF